MIDFPQRGQQENGHRTLLLAQLLAYFKATETWQQYIKDNQIIGSRQRHQYRVVTMHDQVNGIMIPLQPFFEARTQARIILNNQDTHHHPLPSLIDPSIWLL